MAKDDEIQAQDNEPSPVLADESGEVAIGESVLSLAHQLDLPAAGAAAVSATPEPGPSPAGESGPPAARGQLTKTWNWLTTGVWAAFAWLGLTLAAWVAMGQIGAVVAEVTTTGQFPVSALTGIGQLGSLATAPHATLMAWDEAGLTFHALGLWLWCYLGLDLLFVVGFSMLGIAILKHRPNTRPARWLLAVTAAACAAEAGMGALTLALARPSATGTGFPGALAWPLHVATELKWIAVIALAGWIAYRVHASYLVYASQERDYSEQERTGVPKGQRTGIYADLRRLSHALQIQRFSLVVVVLLALIAIGPPLSGTLEQMPDVQRAWFNQGSFLGYPQLLTTAAFQVLLALMLLSLGWMRSLRASAKIDDSADHRADPNHLVWFAIPVIFGAAALILWLAGGARVSWNRVIACGGILLIIASVSKIIGVAVPDLTAKVTRQRDRTVARSDPNVIGIAKMTGNVLAVAVLAVTPLGVVRSFTVPALVIGDRTALVALVAGLGAAFALPLLCGLIPSLRNVEVHADEAPAGDPQTREQRRKRNRHLAGSTRVMWIFGAVFLVADIWLILAPLSATHVLGVLATVVIAIGSLASLLGTLAFLAQTRQPLSLFSVLRLNVTPVLTIIVIIAIAGGIADRNSALHRVSGPVATGGPARPSLAAALATWLHSPLTASCALPAPAAQPAASHPVRIEPLIQVAASGGGIRAAWWAVRVLGTLARTPCGLHDVFAVSSVSGGSVGTAVLASVPPGTARPVSAADTSMTTMADPDALAAAIDGLMVRDTIAGYTGLDFWAAQMPASKRFPDRAALMESVWQNQDPLLRQPFPLRHSWLPWALLFNATSVSTGCRAILSSVALPDSAPTAPGAAGLPCGLGTAGLTGSYDFFDRLACQRNIATATAALLSARYAYITPSGTLDGCGQARGTFEDQLVDGGYGDSSGLATLADLAPTVMARIRQYNDLAMASARRGQPVTLVMPVTVYLGNSVQPARAVVIPARTPEISVPTSALSIGPATELTGTDALLQDIAAETGQGQWMTCAADDLVCANAQATAHAAVPDQLVMVTPTEYPGVAAPLGWLLSQASQKALNRAVRRDVTSPPCAPYRSSKAAQHPYCLPGVGDLADLLALTGPNK